MNLHQLLYTLSELNYSHTEVYHTGLQVWSFCKLCIWLMVSMAVCTTGIPGLSKAISNGLETKIFPVTTALEV